MIDQLSVLGVGLALIHGSGMARFILFLVTSSGRGSRVDPHFGHDSFCSWSISDHWGGSRIDPHFEIDAFCY